MFWVEWRKLSVCFLKIVLCNIRAVTANVKKRFLFFFYQYLMRQSKHFELETGAISIFQSVGKGEGTLRHIPKYCKHASMHAEKTDL